MTTHQQAVIAELDRNVRAGLTHRADLEREHQTLDQLRLTALQSERERVATEVQLATAARTRQAMRSGRGHLSTPEMAAREDQLVRVELDMVKLKAESEVKRGLVR